MNENPSNQYQEFVQTNIRSATPRVKVKQVGLVWQNAQRGRQRGRPIALPYDPRDTPLNCGVGCGVEGKK
jgi:hypothetical protein